MRHKFEDNKICLKMLSSNDIMIHPNNIDVAKSGVTVYICVSYFVSNFRYNFTLRLIRFSLLISSHLFCGGFVSEHAAYGAPIDYTSEITAPPSHTQSSRYLILFFRYDIMAIV